VSFLLFSISKALIIFLGQTNDAHETHMYTNLTNNGDCKLFGKWLLILGCFILWCPRSIPFIYRSYISSFQSCMIFHILPPLIRIVRGPTPYKGIYGLNCVNCTISTKYWPYKPYSSRFLQLPKIMLWILTQTDKNIVWNLSWQKSFSSLKFIKYNLNES
jgi:hypothetical protein